MEREERPASGPKEGKDAERGGKAPSSPTNRVFREKMKRKIETLTTEIELLEKEKEEKNSQYLIEIEAAQEIRRRAERYRREETERRRKRKKEERMAVCKESLESFNKLVFEMENLPLEYILSQSTKIVLTEEWLAALLEREILERLSEIRQLQGAGVFLEVKRSSDLPVHQIHEARRRILVLERKRREVLKKLAESASPALLQKWPKMCPRQTIPPGECIIPKRTFAKREVFVLGLREAEGRWMQGSVSQEELYKKLLHLFSLMKSSKSSTRFEVPISKKGSITTHSSHIACLEKIKNELGKLTTVADLAKYREKKKMAPKQPQGLQNPVHLSMYKTRKHAMPIPYSQEEHSKRVRQEDEPEGERRAIAMLDKDSVKNHPHIKITYKDDPEKDEEGKKE
jgi:hypothetical protein